MTDLSELKRTLERPGLHLWVLDYSATHSLLRVSVHEGDPIFHEVLVCGGLLDYRGPFPQGGPYRLAVSSVGTGASTRVTIADLDSGVSITCREAAIKPGFSRAE